MLWNKVVSNGLVNFACVLVLLTRWCLSQECRNRGVMIFPSLKSAEMRRGGGGGGRREAYLSPCITYSIQQILDNKWRLVNTGYNMCHIIIYRIFKDHRSTIIAQTMASDIGSSLVRSKPHICSTPALVGLAKVPCLEDLQTQELRPNDTRYLDAQGAS